MNFFLLRCLNFLGIKIRFDRPLNLTTGKPLIIVANHQSTYDIPPIIWHLKKFHPKFISKKQLGRGIPGVSYNLRNGGSVLIDRSRPEESIELIKIFAQKLERNKWSAVIFPEGTRSQDGKPKKFHKKGLMTLIENMPNAVILPISINNSWRIAKYNYFPIPTRDKNHLYFPQANNLKLYKCRKGFISWPIMPMRQLTTFGASNTI